MKDSRKTTKVDKVNLRKPDIKYLEVRLVGETPYLPEPMDDAVLEMYNAKKSKKTYKKDDIGEEEKVKSKYYWTQDGKKGLPARAVYKAMIRASRYIIDRKDGGMGKIREGVVVLGDVLPLEYDNEKILTHWGRTPGQNRSPRKIMRNAFNGWSVNIRIQFNADQISAEQIVNVLYSAGVHIGVGGFRRENSGQYGMFDIEIV